MLAISVFIFLFGLLIGSFLNVVIHRLPKEESIVFPGSTCPSCKSKISWYDNIPVLSYLVLRGKCRHCSTKISWVYPAVEALCAFFALLLFPSSFDILSPDPKLLYKFVVEFSIACIFLAHFIIDLRHQILPDKLNLYLALILLPYAIFHFPLIHWALGATVGFLAPYLVTWLFYKLKGQIGLGGGDIKLFGILGLYLGPIGVMNTIFMSSFLGAIVGVFLISLKKMERSSHMAFGPYILIVAAIQIFFPRIFSVINPFTLN